MRQAQLVEMRSSSVFLADQHNGERAKRRRLDAIPENQPVGQIS
jgi:hypothetical protein